ncbi:hypothetical protein C2845_PM01G42080 [Panicum miliaceum]|uniref:F-box domain-containing protein n=1 Tax=Panicum miliaceum TaxID=4540 RepID=A0A3L6TNB2_PANMI|nr:hypothetical protein C2845_PM01G42080 [Panicum miliaceum]
MALIEDVISKSLLRLPPEEPEHLFCATLVCKLWLHVLCDPPTTERLPSSGSSTGSKTCLECSSDLILWEG